MQEPLDAEVEELDAPLYLHALSKDGRILHDKAQIANGAFDLRVAELAQQAAVPVGPGSRQRTVPVLKRRIAPSTAC
jgi:hypothetical protein